MKPARHLGPFIALLLLAVAGTGVATALQRMHKPAEEVPTIRVQRGSVDTRAYADGELRSARTETLVAPAVGGTLQIVRLRRTGELVKAGDVVAEFDPSEQQYNLEQARSDLEQAEQEIVKAKADAAVQAAQDQVDLLKARYDVRRAELEVSKNELVSAIDARKNQLSLDEARRHLAQLEQDVKSRAASSAATIAVSEERRQKALLAIQQAQHNIDELKLKSPIDGMVAVKTNYDALGGMIISGVPMPEYREGDQVWPGRVVAQVLDVNQMEIQAKVEETDRAGLNPGQPVEVHVAAIPDETFGGRAKNVAGMASRNWWWGGSERVRKFDVSFQLDKSDPRFRPGISAQVVILNSAAQNALYLPTQAVFEKDGKPVVYVRTGSRFEAREIKIVRRTESRIIVDGLKEGAEVALVNPEQHAKAGPKPAGPLVPGAAGGAP